FEQSKALQDENFLVLIRENDFSDTGLRTYKKCLGLSFITQVLADGGVYPCCQFFRMDNFCYGNINNLSFEKIWKSNRKNDIINYVESKINVSECMTHCRHHNINKYLWQLYNPPEHINFI
ncbi:radical SAM domain protein, partial [Candidatus Magnetomorum sp. HK-1]